MRNPLDHVSSDFWRVLNDFDTCVRYINDRPAGPGERMNPWTGQFAEVRELDIDKIRKVADEFWIGNNSVIGLRATAEGVASQLEEIRQYVAEGWSGDDFLAFVGRISSLIEVMHKFTRPADEMADSLKKLASALEESITETITTITGLGAIITALATVTATSLAIPDVTISKIITLVAGIVTAIVAAMGFVNALMKGVEDRQKAVNAVIEECSKMISCVRSN